MFVCSGLGTPDRGSGRCIHVLAETDQREMSERWHRPPLDQRNTGRALGPLGEPPPRKFRTPAEPPRDRREPLLERAAQSLLRADMIDQDDLAAGLEHA